MVQLSEANDSIQAMVKGMRFMELTAYQNEVIRKVSKGLPIIINGIDPSIEGVSELKEKCADNNNVSWEECSEILSMLVRHGADDTINQVLGLDLADISLATYDPSISPVAHIWHSSNYDGQEIVRGIVPVPIGLRNYRCPKCNSIHIRGALIMPTADDDDPNLLCLSCGYWWD